MSPSNMIFETRKKMGLSQTKLAKMIGVSGVALHHYEYGRRFPRIKTAYRIIEIAKLYGIAITLEDIYINKN